MSDLFQCGGDNCPTAWCGNSKAKRPPTPKHNPAPEYFGYDVAKVPGVQCMHCKQPIGDKPYREDRGLARFGTMLFWCLPCVEAGDAL